MFLKIVIIAVGLLSLAVSGLMLNILIRKGGRFPAYRVGHNREMARLGIACVKHEEIACLRARSQKSNVEDRNEAARQVEENQGEVSEMCAGCQHLT